MRWRIPRPENPLLAVVVTLLAGLAAWLMAGTGFANYDTFYAMVWGDDLISGRLPDYDVTLAPTPHPLANLVAAAFAPLGDGAETAWVIVGLLSLGALTWLVYALGSHWFGPAAGALAALIIITREPVLSFGIRAYVDFPYVVLVLAALLVEVRRRRAGIPVLLLLGLAGLLRPEAWLFSAAYVAYLFLGGERAPRRLAGLVGVAAAAPLLWLIADLIVTGDPFYSLSGTRATAEMLQRKTGLVNVVKLAPRRIGEILREPVLAGMLVGLGMTWWWLRERARTGVIALAIALVAFAILGIAGLSILGRYLILPAALLAIFCGAGAFGWLLLPRENKWRRRWMIAGFAVLAALAAFTPNQVDRISNLHASIRIQRQIRDDLQSLAQSSVVQHGCRPVTVPNHRPVPLLALWLDERPQQVFSAQLVQPTQGLFFAPASSEVESNFTLDPHDPKRLTASVPERFREVARNRSWILYSGCS